MEDEAVFQPSDILMSDAPTQLFIGSIENPSAMVYSPEELNNATVTDSEGYILGLVERVSIQPESVLIDVYTEQLVKETQDDIDLLKKNLLSTVRKTFGNPSYDDLYRAIGRELGEPNITDQIIVKYAKSRNLAIPAKESMVTKRVSRGKIPWSLVGQVTRSDEGVYIVLNRPIEAEERKILLREEVPYEELSQIKGKTVLDSEAKHIGQVSGILIDRNGLPQLTLVKRIRETKEEPDISQLEEKIMTERKWNKRKLYTNIRSDLRLPSDPSQGDLLRWAKTKNIPIMTHTVVTYRDVNPTFLVPWTYIRKAGDIILLNKRVEEII
jgi:sporulation protein YlmC with PRC-barrel domain